MTESREMPGRVRPMTRADVRAVSMIRVAGWQSAYAGIIPKSYLDGMSVDEDARNRMAVFRSPQKRAVDLVAVDESDTPVGWGCYGPYRGDVDLSAAAELYALYVRPDLIGTGLGRRLLDEVHGRATAQDYRSILLWVLRGNERARRFYSTASYDEDGAVSSDHYADRVVAEVRYRRRL